MVLATVLFVAAYSALIGVRYARSQPEFFPFFKWDLFSAVPPSTSQDFSVRLTEVNGRELAAPIYFADAEEFLSQSESPDAVPVFNRLGRALVRDHPREAERLRELVEGRFLRDLDSASYQVVHRTFDQLERVRCNCFLEEDVLAEYELG